MEYYLLRQAPPNGAIITSAEAMEWDVAMILKLKSTSMISRWEKGTCLPNSLNIFRLSLLYRTLIDVLFIDLMRLLKEDLRKREEKVLKAKDKKERKNER